jgi:hypothetical protein
MKFLRKKYSDAKDPTKVGSYDAYAFRAVAISMTTYSSTEYGSTQKKVRFTSSPFLLMRMLRGLVRKPQAQSHH